MWILTASRRLQLTISRGEARTGRITYLPCRYWQWRFKCSYQFHTTCDSKQERFPHCHSNIAFFHSGKAYTQYYEAVIMHTNYARFNGYSGATDNSKTSPDSSMFVSLHEGEHFDMGGQRPRVTVSCTNTSSSPFSLSTTSPLQPLYC